MELYKQLEEKYAMWVGKDYAVSCNSGTSALHLALLALGIGPGDEVIVPDFTMAACPFAVSYTGAKPVFVDCNKYLNHHLMRRR
jgi:dTDP-4-amino-4,6-dideoxygalactose transaminase